MTTGGSPITIKKKPQLFDPKSNKLIDMASKVGANLTPTHPTRARVPMSCLILSYPILSTQISISSYHHASSPYCLIFASSSRCFVSSLSPPASSLRPTPLRPVQGRAMPQQQLQAAPPPITTTRQPQVTASTYLWNTIFDPH